MTEPVSTTTTVVSASTFSVSVVKAIFYIFGPVAGVVVVIALSPPTSFREWVAALISTFMSSVSLGSYVVVSVLDTSNPDFFFFLQVGGIFFTCALPGWFFVRALFLMFTKHKNKDIIEITEILKEAVKK